MFEKVIIEDCLGNKIFAYLSENTWEYRIPALADAGDIIYTDEKFDTITDCIEDLKKTTDEFVVAVEIQ